MTHVSIQRRQGICVVSPTTEGIGVFTHPSINVDPEDLKFECQCGHAYNGVVVVVGFVSWTIGFSYGVPLPRFGQEHGIKQQIMKISIEDETQPGIAQGGA
mmetsp:Transcript_37500/g.43650  ORF Transcript_37500/g.43650 Transcript_37500/m.43650 type:complete len:101 (-) Transcript_37500:652-954(-)